VRKKKKTENIRPNIVKLKNWRQRIRTVDRGYCVTFDKLFMPPFPYLCFLVGLLLWVNGSICGVIKNSISHEESWVRDCCDVLFFCTQWAWNSNTIFQCSPNPRCRHHYCFCFPETFSYVLEWQFGCTKHRSFLFSFNF
jgi:hypothetical protein